MGKEHQKRVLAALMAASIAIPTPVLAASPADFSDFPNNWATNALSYAVSNGLLSGDSGKIRANDTLKRAEMAAILNRLAGAVKGASLTGYTDVPATAWYYEDMAKAVQMGTFAGWRYAAAGSAYHQTGSFCGAGEILLPEYVQYRCFAAVCRQQSDCAMGKRCCGSHGSDRLYPWQ